MPCREFPLTTIIISLRRLFIGWDKVYRLLTNFPCIYVKKNKNGATGQQMYWLKNNVFHTSHSNKSQHSSTVPQFVTDSYEIAVHWVNSILDTWSHDYVTFNFFTHKVWEIPNLHEKKKQHWLSKCLLPNWISEYTNVAEKGWLFTQLMKKKTWPVVLNLLSLHQSILPVELEANFIGNQVSYMCSFNEGFTQLLFI